MRTVLSIVTIGVVTLSAPARANEPILGLFREYLESLRIQAGIPGLSAVIVGRDEVIWEQGFGFQDIEEGTPATPRTAYHLDGLTQLFTSALVLRCVERGVFTLDTPIGEVNPTSPEPEWTIGELLTHTRPDPVEAAVFAYDPDRLSLLPPVIRRACTGDSFRETLADQLEQLGMLDSVPGPDAVRLVRPAEGVPSPSQMERYRRTLARLATSYAVNGQKRAVPTTHPETTLTAASGLISTARDLAKFDLAIKDSDLLDSDTLRMAWQPPEDSDGEPLPHGAGWFVQRRSGERIVWQFGVSKASSSLVIMVPGRGLTLVLLANSSGLVKPFDLEDGDLTASPFGRLFLGLLVR
jgi:CubicO group peptidase (beta-lactamase class C family)